MNLLFEQKNPHTKKTSLSLKPRKYFLQELIIVVGIVLVWRGIWLLADRFFFPSYPIVSEVFGILIGLFLLYLPDGDLSYLTGERHHDTLPSDVATQKRSTKKE